MFLLRGCRHPSLGQQKGAGGSRPTEGLWGEALPALSPQAAATLSTWHTLLKSAESILGTSSLPSWLPGTVCSPRPPDPDPQPHTPHLCPPALCQAHLDSWLGKERLRGWCGRLVSRAVVTCADLTLGTGVG